MHRSLPASGVVAAAALLALTGCSVAAGTQPTASPTTATEGPTASPDPVTELGAVPEPLPSGEVLGQGLVLDAGTPILCLGDVGASLPPTCGGLPLAGWDWSAVDGWESQGSTRWGSYAVRGTWDGDAFAITDAPISLALYDPAPMVQSDPAPGTTPEAELTRIQAVLHDALGVSLLRSTPADGFLQTTVVYDDGTLQAHLDDIYGASVVHVSSALVDVTG